MRSDHVFLLGISSPQGCDATLMGMGSKRWEQIDLLIWNETLPFLLLAKSHSFSLSPSVSLCFSLEETSSLPLSDVNSPVYLSFHRKYVADSLWCNNIVSSLHCKNIAGDLSSMWIHLWLFLSIANKSLVLSSSMQIHCGLSFKCKHHAGIYFSPSFPFSLAQLSHWNYLEYNNRVQGIFLYYCYFIRD